MRERPMAPEISATVQDIELHIDNFKHLYYNIIQEELVMSRKILSLSLPFGLLKEIQQVAKDEHLSKSELLRRAILDFIGKWRWEQARKAGKRALREMRITEADIEGIVHGARQK